MRIRILLLLTVVVGGLQAQNPVIRDQFSADPTARVFNGKVYLYPSHDIPSPVEQLKEWFCMADYHVFSSTNLTDWTDHGVILTQNNVPWVQPDSYSMWAPDCVCKDGKYYFYFPSTPKGEGRRGFNIGVATADAPEGPFTPAKEPIKDVFGIDPCVLVDTDGEAYIYWSGMGISVARLKPNMMELASKPVRVQGLPEGFKEGPYAFKREGKYYLTFPWVQNQTETLAYAMSDSPTGPFTFKGIIMEESPTGCWTNHHSITEYNGQWYLFYHHNDYSPDFDKNRSVRIDSLFFQKDGTIKKVKPTLRGVGITAAESKIQLDRCTALSTYGAYIDYLNPANPFEGWQILLNRADAWVRYNDVDFGSGTMTRLKARVRADKGGKVCIRTAGDKGVLIAELPVKPTAEWTEMCVDIDHAPAGVQDLTAVSVGEYPVAIDWISFESQSGQDEAGVRENARRKADFVLAPYFSPATGQAMSPDEDGFIRRWLLLEPIDKPNRTNTVFTDSYLREVLAAEYYPKQFTGLPADGDKVKVGKQKLAWHALESNLFNVKLFRFASNLDKQFYGVLFLATTVIECREDIPDVRMSVGSNSASMWWLNGEEVLMLSGDRRMVKDDCLSKRLTLKKGKNIIRGAVINGPGMSDFCLRFLHENGNPVKNITVSYK